MDATQAILTRRSIRKYTPEPVSDETVTELLRAAMSAPTAAGEVWDFVIVRDRSILEGVSKFHPHAEMLKSTAAIALAILSRFVEPVAPNTSAMP